VESDRRLSVGRGQEVRGELRDRSEEDERREEKEQGERQAEREEVEQVSPIRQGAQQCTRVPENGLEDSDR